MIRIAAAALAAAAGVAAADEGDLTFHGYLQADAVLYSQASVAEVSPAGAPLNQTRFTIRRARLEARWTRGFAGAVLELDGNTVNGPTARIIDAEATAAWAPYVEGAIGLMKIPFGREVPESDRDRLFLERSNAANALFPGTHDLGARAGGAWRQVRWVVAVMNGDPIGERAFPGLDPTPAKDVLGRLGVDAQVGPAAIVAGVSGLGGTGFHPGTPATKDTLVWRDVNEDGIVQTTEIQVIAGSAAGPSATFARFALGADARAALEWPGLGKTTVAAEVVWAQNLDRALEPADPVSAGRDLRELGFEVEAVQELLGRFELGVRYDHYVPDRDASQRIGTELLPRDNRFATLAVAAGFRPEPALRVVLEYDHNWNALGRGPDGQSTTLGRDLVTVRAQVVF